jgi:hypothetical protein
VGANGSLGTFAVTRSDHLWVRAVEGFVAYAGRYTLHRDRVVHHVDLSLFPNWAGRDQERSLELSGERLTLRAGPLLLAGKQQLARLLWKRVGAGA